MCSVSRRQLALKGRARKDRHHCRRVLAKLRGVAAFVSCKSCRSGGCITHTQLAGNAIGFKRPSTVFTTTCPSFHGFPRSGSWQQKLCMRRFNCRAVRGAVGCWLWRKFWHARFANRDMSGPVSTLLWCRSSRTTFYSAALLCESQAYLEVHVVGGLVQDEDVGLRQQRCRKGDPPPLAAAEGRHRCAQHAGRQSNRLKHVRCLRAGDSSV